MSERKKHRESVAVKGGCVCPTDAVLCVTLPGGSKGFVRRESVVTVQEIDGHVVIGAAGATPVVCADDATTILGKLGWADEAKE